MLEFQVITRREELFAIAEPWSALCDSCDVSTMFQRPEWLIPWCRELGPEEVLVLACRSEERLVGLAPFSVQRRGGERVVALLGTGVTDYNDVLAAPGFDAAVGLSVFSFLGERAGAWDALDFEALRPTSPLLAVEAPRAWSDEVTRQEACPVLPIPAGAAPESVVPRSLVARLVRARQRIDPAGKPRVELADAQDVDEVLGALFETHRACWNARGSGGVLDEALRPFHHAVAHGMLARGALRLFALRLGERIIAALYAFADRGTLALYLSGFDPAYARLSPGLQVLAGAIEHAAREGARSVDFLRGREAYKYTWGAVDRWIFRRRLRRPRGCAADGAVACAGRSASLGRAAALHGVLDDECSVEIALTRLLSAAEDVGDVERSLIEAEPRTERDVARIRAILGVLGARREDCAMILGLLRAHRAAAASGPAAPARYAALFDALVGRSEEASVAAYALGDPALFERATREVVDLLARFDRLGAGRRILQIGCGIGRFEAALAGLVGEAWGTDVSPRMVEAARRRCAGLLNVRIEISSGVDLGGMASGCFDLVYAVDAFPYIVDAGAAVVDRHFAEAHRVLRPAGAMFILGYSYRGDPERDAADVARLSARHGFEVESSGERPFTLWDGRVYRLRALS